MHERHLTICSVAFHSAGHLTLNWHLTRDLNAGQTVQWVVAENTPPESDERVAAGTETFIVYRGDEFDPNHPRPASQHHGLGLNRIIKLVRTRFVLILDPDFYIVRPNWVAEVLDHMETSRLAFFGAPWHPTWYGKYRYFPCVHCLFIDLDQVPVSSLDFRPGHGGLGSEKGPWKLRLIDVIRRSLPRMALDVLYNIRGRRAIGGSEDTGYDLYRRHAGNRDLRSESVTPVYRFERDYPVTSPQRLSRVLDEVVPDRLSYRPKRPASYTTAGFKERGFPDVRAHGWEEFIWKEAPFGFHVRQQQLARRDPNREIATLERTLARWTGET